jgi:PKD repeat protein
VQAQVIEAYGKLPLSFEANEGQTNSQIKFMSRGKDYNLFLTSTEAVLAFSNSSTPNAREGSSLPNRKGQIRSAMAHRAVLRMKLIGANSGAQVMGLDELPGKSNYFNGNDPGKWRSNIPSYARVKYNEVYPGVDMVYYGNQRQLEYDLVVAPGADPGIIELAFEGARKMRLDASGDLVIQTASGELRQHKPVAYQEVNGIQQAVASHYIIKGNKRIGLQVAEYDGSKPLVIDPILSYSTYLGTASWETGYGIDVDSSGNAYVTGFTESVNFPSSNPFQTTYGGGVTDTFVTKLNSTGSALIYSTYIGGNHNEHGYKIKVDASGNAYIAGFTYSTNFPTVNPVQPTSGGEEDAFVAKLSADGSALLFSSYLGGRGDERCFGLALDSSSNIYLTGGTLSNNFPTANPLQATLGGPSDAFVTKLSPTGSAFIYSTYFGGSNAEEGTDIATDSAGNAYITGFTGSSDFPRVNPFRSVLASGEAFISKINPAGTTLVYSTYLGGNSWDYGFGITVVASGKVYVTGITDSTDFPTVNPLQLSKSGGSDAFVTELSADGSTLLYSTYLGGNREDRAHGIAIDSLGNIYVAGVTASGDFPLSNPLQAAYGGGSLDAFVSKLNAAGNAMIYSTYLGGSGDEGLPSTGLGPGLAIDSASSVYIMGGTGSTNLPIKTGAFQTSYGGANDAFVIKISDVSAVCTLTCTASASSSGTVGVPISFQATATPSLECSGSPIYEWDFGDGSTHSSQQNPSHSYEGSGTFTWTMTTSFAGSSSCAKTGTITMTPTCTLGSIKTQPANQTIANGQSATLRVELSEPDPMKTTFYFCDWFEGLSGDTSKPVSSGPIGSNGIFTTPSLTRTTSYWVRVSFNHDLSCAVNSNTAMITVAPLHTPVLIVPGVYATNLYKGEDQLWLNLTKALLPIDPTDGFLDPLEIKPNLEPTDGSIVARDVVRKIDPPTHIFDFDYTQGLIDELKSHGYKEGTDIFLFPYDWRFGVSTATVEALQKKINEIISKPGFSKVNIVAHSTGGLIVKKYIQQNASPKIEKVVFVGVPNLGAPKAINVLLTGDTGLIGHNRDKMKKLAMNMPIVYDLSPSARYFSIKGSFMQVTTATGFFSQTIQNMNDAETRDHLVRERGANQQAFSNSINLHSTEFDNLDLRTKGIDFYNIIGCGKGTVGRVHEQRYLFGNSTYSVTYTPGDGTVPIESARSVPVDSSKLYYATNADHGKMPSQPGIREQIAKIFTNDPSPTTGIYNALQCQLNGKVIFMASPVDIIVTDQDGNYAGPVEDGTLVNNIPNADYNIIGEHKSIYLPDDEGQIYSIQLKGTGNGTFTLKIDDINNSGTVGSEIFPNIPVSTKLAGNLQEQNNRSVLRLDTNGDGTFDQTLTPPVVVTQQQLTQRQNLNTGTITLRAPEGTPAPGTYPQPQTVSLSAPDWDMIYYTTDGTDPSFGKGQIYITEVAIPSSKTVKAIGCFADGSCSNIVTFSYTISTMQLSQANYTIGEEDGSLAIQINRTVGSTGEARVNYATSNVTTTAGSDYMSTSGTLVFADGETVKTFNVPINSDVLDENDETVMLTLSSATGTSSLGEQTTAVLTIIDDDQPPGITINDVSATEGNSSTTNVVFTAMLLAPSSLTVTVNYQTTNGTATAPSDYQAITSTQLIFLPGETTKNITVLVNGDILIEADETFLIDLSGAANATLARAQGTGLILNDEAMPPQLSLILDESGPNSAQAAALDSILFLRDPFLVVNAANLLNQLQDRNTRVIIFVTNLQLEQGENSSSVIVNLISNNQSYDIVAEDVRPIPLFSFTQVVFRLPDNLSPGTCSIKVKVHAQESNVGTIRIRN